MKRKIYFAGGCFWGMQKAFQQCPGIIYTECGYANGNPAIHPDYKRVCKGDTEYKECVYVEYNDEILSLSKLLDVFFYVIDPSQKNQQAEDVGTQYQTGIYFVSEEDETVIQTYVSSIKKNYTNFYTEVFPLSNFFTAEAYHQNYLIKNPEGYCHIPQYKYETIQKLKKL